ncbi:MAG: hypothetical protein UY13_C0002G0292 [Candidatus Pacebacteria bacterium GW2011_GWB1_47_8]|nr:MAG: hypothetical protein UX28_C0001G0440 [Candidatus Pacebacteria bacterium GW2011_GWA1_46_10]KKU84380.1 MAG: hypothetical protein UY13_C0002G0292 [Candidatus Pacebacteria bacterium GW2011_GWB1_47_8]HCR81193.1 hypothetical protein [Candidatus Paceibacterota bacterium]
MKKHFWLALILAVALVMRVWRVGNLPAILNRDEAAVAYNAYLLMETGKDEWGRRWPLALESFGDYKLSGYSVVLVPFFQLFGLHDWVVRLPSVMAGTVLVYLLYLLGKKLKLGEQYALLLALLAAVAPVFVFYSRMAFEANLGLTFFVGALLVLWCLKDQTKKWQYPLLFLLLLSAVLTYNTPLLLLPLVMVWVGLTYDWRQWGKLVATEGILGGVLLFGVLALWPVTAQKSGITIFTDETVWSQWTIFRGSLSLFWQPLIGSRSFYYLVIMLQNFFNSFSFNFLSLRGGTHPWHSLPTTGHLATVTYLLGLLGIFKTSATVWLGRRKLRAIKSELGLLFLLIASLLPAIITVDAPHATRSLLFFVLWHVLAVWGAVWLIKVFFQKNSSAAWRWLLFLVVVEGLLHAYQLFGLYPNQQTVFQPGFDQVIQRVEREHGAENVAIVDPTGYWYILTAWYLQLSPAVYFETAVRQLPDPIGFRYGERVGRYHFIARPDDRSSGETVLVQWSDQASAWQIEEN